MYLFSTVFENGMTRATKVLSPFGLNLKNI